MNKPNPFNPTLVQSMSKNRGDAIHKLESYCPKMLEHLVKLELSHGEHESGKHWCSEVNAMMQVSWRNCSVKSGKKLKIEDVEGSLFEHVTVSSIRGLIVNLDEEYAGLVPDTVVTQRDFDILAKKVFSDLRPKIEILSGMLLLKREPQWNSLVNTRWFKS